MPILGGLLLSLFTGLAEFFALYMAKRIAVTAAAGVAFVALLAVLATALSALAAGLMAGAPNDSYFSTGLFFAIPSNAVVCMSAWLACDAACGAYKIGITQVRIAAAA